MGEAKRRKQLDPNYGKSKPVRRVFIRESELTGKWVIIADVLGLVDVQVSAHKERENAEALTAYVLERLNLVSREDWLRFCKNRDTSVLYSAMDLLEYEDDDEFFEVTNPEVLANAAEAGVSFVPVQVQLKET